MGFKVDLRALQEATTTDDMATDDTTTTTTTNDGIFTDNANCDASTEDETTGAYVDGESGATCTAETGYEACPCWGLCGPQCQQDAGEAIATGLGIMVIVGIALAICVPLTCCITIGCVVYHCVIKKKD